MRDSTAATDGREERRGLSRRVATLAAGAVAISLLTATPAVADPPRPDDAGWPHGSLIAADAKTVKRRQFVAKSQFTAWHRQLDAMGPAGQRGLRAAGSRAHAAYVDQLVAQLRDAGVSRVRKEVVPMKRWTTSSWSLQLRDAGKPRTIRTASYIPYSGRTGKSGVTGKLVHVPSGTTPAPDSLTGKIAVFDVTLPPFTLATLLALSYPGTEYDPKNQLTPQTSYQRPYLEQGKERLAALERAGAAGAIGVLNMPVGMAKGSYFPYDGIVGDMPGVWVDREVGARLRTKAGTGARATVTVPATIKKVRTHNIVGFIPGRSSRLVTLTSHTDGTNALEDNGPAAIVAMSQYLSRLPKKALPRTVMVLLSAGHFAGGVGIKRFVKVHRTDLVRRSKAALEIEHLGAREWGEVKPDRMGPTGRFEAGAVFAPNSKGLVRAASQALQRGRISPSGVLRPLNPNGNGTRVPVWPGEGQYLYALGGMLTANFITGPTYLLNWGIRTANKIDDRRVRNSAISFTEMVLQLGRTSTADLRAPVTP